MKTNIILGSTALLLSFLSFTANADWCSDHPARCLDHRRGSVYMENRMANSNMTEEQKQAIEQQIQIVQQQRQQEAAANGGHLTAAEQYQQDGELNYISQEIYQEKHP